MRLAVESESMFDIVRPFRLKWDWFPHGVLYCPIISWHCRVLHRLLGLFSLLFLFPPINRFPLEYVQSQQLSAALAIQTWHFKESFISYLWFWCISTPRSFRRFFSYCGLLYKYRKHPGMETREADKDDKGNTRHELSVWVPCFQAMRPAETRNLKHTSSLSILSIPSIREIHSIYLILFEACPPSLWWKRYLSMNVPRWEVWQFDANKMQVPNLRLDAAWFDDCSYFFEEVATKRHMVFVLVAAVPENFRSEKGWCRNRLSRRRFCSREPSYCVACAQVMKRCSYYSKNFEEHRRISKPATLGLAVDIGERCHTALRVHSKEFCQSRHITESVDTKNSWHILSRTEIRVSPKSALCDMSPRIGTTNAEIPSKSWPCGSAKASTFMSRDQDLNWTLGTVSMM